MSIVIKNSLEEIWSKTGNNDYTLFADLKEKYGIYIFRDTDGKVLYIGEARKQDLKTRVTQNFSKNDSGGTFRKNFIACTSGNFESFKEAMNSADILFIVSTHSDMLIRALESLLILMLKPSYNKDA